jgi:hypothetical protein
MSGKSLDHWLALVLVAFLLAVGVGSVVAAVYNFPEEQENTVVFPKGDDGGPRLVPFGAVASNEQGFVALALLAGMTGSFLHAGQSLITFLGNSKFKASWAAW